MTVQNTGSAIHILDQATVNQIAAGEVVERPASVVKELVENAIDAGARSIRIDITTSAEGIGSIQVTDDGCGMTPSDAVLAFTPHATSKILRIEDLNTIHTLGFRGEALASIAAVARVTLTTRSREPGIIAGIKVVAEGGKILQTCDIGVPQGTSIQVQDLFFNTPARKKFQKSRNTELAYIYSLLEGICLTHPEISFRVVTDRNNKIITDRSSNILDTIARIFGSHHGKGSYSGGCIVPSREDFRVYFTSGTHAKGHIPDDGVHQPAVCIVNNNQRGCNTGLRHPASQRPVPDRVSFPDD